MQKRLNWHDPIAATIRESVRKGEAVVVEFDGVPHQLVAHSNGRTPSGFHVDSTWRPLADNFVDDWSPGDAQEPGSAEVAEQSATQEAATDDNTDETPDDAAGLGQSGPETVAGDQRPYEI